MLNHMRYPKKKWDLPVQLAISQQVFPVITICHLPLEHCGTNGLFWVLPKHLIATVAMKLYWVPPLSIGRVADVMNSVN